MVSVDLPYGESTVAVELPERAMLVGGGDGRPRLSPVADQEAAVREALANPLGMPRVRELVRPAPAS